jgi:hypothetical protein
MRHWRFSSTHQNVDVLAKRLLSDVQLGDGMNGVDLAKAVQSFCITEDSQEFDRVGDVSPELLARLMDSEVAVLDAPRFSCLGGTFSFAFFHAVFGIPAQGS